MLFTICSIHATFASGAFYGNKFNLKNSTKLFPHTLFMRNRKIALDSKSCGSCFECVKSMKNCVVFITHRKTFRLTLVSKRFLWSCRVRVESFIWYNWCATDGNHAVLMLHAKIGFPLKISMNWIGGEKSFDFVCFLDDYE